MQNTRAILRSINAIIMHKSTEKEKTTQIEVTLSPLHVLVYLCACQQMYSKITPAKLMNELWIFDDYINRVWKQFH